MEEVETIQDFWKTDLQKCNNFIDDYTKIQAQIKEFKVEVEDFAIKGEESKNDDWLDLVKSSKFKKIEATKIFIE